MANQRLQVIRFSGCDAFEMLQSANSSKTLGNQNVERRLDDRIRILFGRLIAIDSPEEFESIACQLRAALSDHVERLRGQVRKYPKHPVTAERRSTDEKSRLA